MRKKTGRKSEQDQETQEHQHLDIPANELMLNI